VVNFAAFNFLSQIRIFEMTLDQLKKGQMAEIVGYRLGNAAYRAKLLALGMTRGTQVKILNVAPLGDPFELAVRGFHLSLRKDEVGVIKVKVLEKGDVK
jgi:Fe2+ transport system protein FeoA